MLRNKRGRDSERPTHRDEEWPPGFPGGAGVENPLANAGNTGSSPGKIPHAVEQQELSFIADGDAKWCSLAVPHKTDHTLGFPGGAVVENLLANAGDAGSSPGLGGSHMPRSDWAREPQLLSLRVWSLCPAAGGAAIVRGSRTAMKSGPHLPQLEKALAQKLDRKSVV